jgi:hypothetical protein
MNLARIVLKLLSVKAMAFERATKDPMSAQKKVLAKYLKRNKNTEYGLKCGFAGIKSIEDYQARVPVSDSEDIYPYIERMKSGQNNILTADRPIFFGLTSGTTGKPKFIPVTGYSRSKKAEVADLWAYYIVKDHPEVLDGKILAIVNLEVEGYADSGVPYGAETGQGYDNLPAVVRRMYAIPREVFYIKDYRTRYYCILRIGMGQDIRTVAVLNPSTLVLLCEKIGEWKDGLIKDIEEGTLEGSLDIPADIRTAIEKRLRPNPRRASELKAIIKEKGELLPKYFWPDMELIECWKGGTVKLYLKELPRYFGDVRIRDFGCLSTEARSSIPMSDYGAGGVLAINTNFYEFIPKEDMGKRKKRFLLSDQLEKDKEYYLVVTTPGGLYRYNIDDIITVDSFFNKTPMIEFVQKGLNAVSVTGEKVYESQVNAAINRAVDKHKMVLRFFSACVEFNKFPHYVFLVEFEEEHLPAEKKRGLLKSIEEELCLENAEYEYSRKSMALGAPMLKAVKSGEFEKYRAKRIAEGVHDAQFKAPELTADPEFQKNFIIDEVVRL